MKHNIYEIPKVHPFIKTLEKVKELRDSHVTLILIFE